jgi:anhydro-N-acetylmuramic acid kinase
MNHLAKQAGEAYDRDGLLARAGKVHESLLEALNGYPFYTQKKAKSLGFEEVESFYLPTIKSFELSPQDSLATFAAHTTDKIHQATEHLRLKKVLVTGGGAYNNYFIQLLKKNASCHFEIGAPTLIEFKEALLFGFLGVLRLTNEVNVLKSVTGASHSSVSGALYRAVKK